MIYRDWKGYQEALAAYNAAKARHDAAVRNWNERRGSFDKESERVTFVSGIGFLAVVVAGCIAHKNGGVAHYSGWFVVYFLLFGFYQTLDAKCRTYEKQRFLAKVPCPQFSAEEPSYEPPAGNRQPPPRNDPPPPSFRTKMTLDAALSILGAPRGATLKEIKRAYHDRIREYHPDKVSHLGAELRELAEQKSKEINAAYECASMAFQGRSHS